jgi:dynein heavy chain
MFSLETWLAQNVRQIEELIVCVRGDLPDIARKIIVALVTVDVHARDIVEELKQQNVSSTSEFKWVQQLRYYWDEEADTCIIR